VTDEAAVQALVATAVDRCGGLDGLGDAEAAARAAIPVERIDAPLLVGCGA
jgi:hypothetical protein